MQYTDEEALDMAVCSAMASARIRGRFVTGLIDRITPNRRPLWLRNRLADATPRADQAQETDADGIGFSHHELTELVGLVIGKSGRALENAIRQHAQSMAAHADDDSDGRSDLTPLSAKNALGAKHPENVL